MSKVDPKWINYDADTLTIIDDAGTNLLAFNAIVGGGIATDPGGGMYVDLQEVVDNDPGLLITDLNAEYINEVRIEVRRLAEGEPTPDNSNGRDYSKDFYVEIPD